ncbi:MAG: chorismate lyase [Proteobacteria bacterium]|nr:chorismate lyase [Pseudomonadota bacterium]
MHPRSLIFQREPVWRPAKASTLGAPYAVRSWLAEPGSLTARLRSAVGAGFGVRLIGQCWARPFADEANLLNLPPRQRVLVREVLLHCEGKPLVLARSIIPPRTLRGIHCGLAHLGDRPLGELLFAYRGLKRSHLEMARVRPTDWKLSIAREFTIESPAWGRRSLYQVGKVSLCVCEFFLPATLSLGHLRECLYP